MSQLIGRSNPARCTHCKPGGSARRTCGATGQPERNERSQLCSVGRQKICARDLITPHIQTHYSSKTRQGLGWRTLVAGVRGGSSRGHARIEAAFVWVLVAVASTNEKFDAFIDASFMIAAMAAARFSLQWDRVGRWCECMGLCCPNSQNVVASTAPRFAES